MGSHLPGVRYSAPEGERRQLTVMFCDLVDSAVLGEQLDPEELHGIVHAYQRSCAAVVERHDGYIAQYAGDGLVVHFGYPVAHENDAERAVDAGLGILEEIAALNTRLLESRGIRLGLRIGIHSGPVVVAGTGGGDERDKQVLGHTVNLAARLQACAEPDSIVTTAATLRLARGLFVTAELGERRLKGMAEPVAIHRVLRRSGARTRLEAGAAAGLTPFVGRDHDVVLLVDRWEQATAGHGQVVLLNGEAGMGKSRLLQVLRERLARRRHLWLEGHCSPYHEHSPFHPVIELLEQELHLDADEPAPQKLASIERALAPTGLPLADAVPCVASLLSVPLPEAYASSALSADGQRRRTLDTLAAWLVSVGTRQPAVVVLEDLHWIDPSTRELVKILVEESATARILVLLTARPGFEAPWPSRSNVTHLTLHALTPSQVAAMVDRLAGGRVVPAEVCRHVVAKTDGVPLFVEELTKAVLESELFHETPARYERRDPLPPFTIPATLQESLTARLDRLGPAKEVAQLAAVLGREFSYELLRAVGSMEAAFVDRALRELARAELVYPRGAVPNATYRFKHALVQEAAYQSLLRSRRQQAHARIVRVLCERFPEQAEAEPEELGRHCAEAGLVAEAVRYYRLAGERAAARSAHAEAAGHLSRGLELLARLPESAARDRDELELRVALGFPLVALHGYGDPYVEETYERARGLCQGIEEAPHLFEAVLGLANYFQSRGILDTARELSEQLVAIADGAKEDRLAVWAHLQLGGALFFSGDAAAALPHFEVAIAKDDPGEPWFLAGAPEPGIAARVYAGWALQQLGYPDRALRTSEEGLALARTCGHPFTLALVLYFHGTLHQARREPAEACERAEETIALAAAQDFPLWQGLGRTLRGWALSHLVCIEAGLEDVQQGLAQLAPTGTEVGASGGMWLLADANRMAGRLEAALGAVDAGLALGEQRRQYTWEGELYWLKGEILLAMNPDAEDEVERCFRLGIERSRAQRKRSFELRAAIGLYRHARRRGRGGDARGLLEEVYGGFTEGFETHDLREARALLAEH